MMPLQFTNIYDVMLTLSCFAVNIFLVKFLYSADMCFLLCRFAARLLAWFLSRVLTASVGFRVAGFNCLRDVTIKFHKVCLSSHAAEALEL